MILKGIGVVMGARAGSAHCLSNYRGFGIIAVIKGSLCARDHLIPTPEKNEKKATRVASFSTELMGIVQQSHVNECDQRGVETKGPCSIIRRRLAAVDPFRPPGFRITDRAPSR